MRASFPHHRRAIRRLAGAGPSLARVLPAPAGACALAQARRLARAIGAAVAVLLLAAGALRLNDSFQSEAELMRYRATLQKIVTLLRIMPTMAAARRQPFQVKVDEARGAVHLVALQAGGPRSLETVEETIWLPRGLDIHSSADPLIAWPGGQRSNGSLTLAAPAYNRIFRVRTDAQGVQLQEAPAT